ncbi:ATP-binding protein [Pseudonocardia lacus]|uniref:ATP-binding protein n=1 Tax=Pseudonocardia lacus TaxID=2835865 RepID=UPI001BDC6DF0|nr:ATP-binding protein [Pseudonocardia lacus]
MRAPVGRPPPLRLRLTGGSLAPQLSGARHEVERWAHQTGLDEPLVEDVVLAAYEALANVADHAYPGGAGDARLDVRRENGVLEATVSDEGRWRPPAGDPGWRGRGLVIIRGLADEVDVRHDETGTVVRMRWMLG